MMRGEARAIGLGVFALLALGAFVALRFQVGTDITHFLPSGDPGHEVQIAKELAAGELSRTMVLLIDADSTEDAVLAAERFEAALKSEPRVANGIAFLDAGPPEGVEEALWKLYQPRRFAFFARDVEATIAGSSKDALRERAAHLKEQLASPLSGLISRVAPEDPTLILPGLLERLEGDSGNGLSVVDGRFVTEDGKASVLFLSTLASSTDAAAQRPLLAGILSAFESVEREFETPIALSISGAGRFAVRAEQSIQADITRVSIGSGLGLALLLLILFRSLRLVLLVLPVVTAGYLAGTAACLALFDSIHGLTLAFGAAMIGVSIDYAVHFHCHQTVAPHAAGPRHTLNEIWKGLSLGAATTIAGFVALLVSSFPGLRELAVFSTAGILAALFATRVFLPGLAITSVPPSLTRALVARITKLLTTQSRVVLAAPALIVLVLTLLGLPRLRWNDDIADLNKLDPELLAEDEAVRSRVVRYEQGRLVIAIGADEEAALRVNDRVAVALESAQLAGELTSARSLATLLPSAEHQLAVDAAVRGNAELWPNLRDALTAQGFVADGFIPFRDALFEPAPEPLMLAELQASPLAALVRPFRVSLGESVGIVSFLHELHDEAALAKRLEAIEGAQLIDIQSALTGAYGTYRLRMVWLALIGLAAVLLLVAARHRALRPTLRAFVPALLGAAGTVAIMSLAGVSLNVLSLVALLMVVSMGVDYGVFLAEAEAGSNALEATHLAVFVAGTSTLLGFGLLAFSDQPPLFSIGLTAGIGVSLCLVLAPTLNALIGAPSDHD